VGDVLGEADLAILNERVKANGGEAAKGEGLIMGILDVSLSRQSFLSAASFQNTTRMLIKASLYGAVDRLEGLKENVIIGRLIPAGTGFKGSHLRLRVLIYCTSNCVICQVVEKLINKRKPAAFEAAGCTECW
jgi:hypothetical protein